MEQVEIVDRDYSEVEEAENDSRKRKTPKIKLTATSANAFDWLYAGVIRKERKLEKVKEKIQNAERKQSEIDEQQGIKGFLSFVVIDIKKNLLQKKKFKLENAIEIKNRRAVRIEDRMKKNILYKYFESLNNLNVNDIDKDSIASAVDDAFDNMSKDYGDNQKVKEPEKDIEVAENDAVVNDDSLKSVIENENIQKIEKPRDRNTIETDDEYNEYLKKFYSPEFKTNYNENGLIEGTYRLRKDDIIQDDLTFKNETVEETNNIESKFEAPAIIPEFQQFFDSIPKVDFVSEQDEKTDSMSMDKDNNNDTTINEEILSKINDKLNDENVTSSDLTKLLEELELVRNSNNKLAVGLDEIVQLDTDMKKQVSAVDQEERKKTELLKEQVEVYKAANSRLKAQIKEVENSVEVQNSILQQKSNNIKLIDEMLSNHAVAVNGNVTKESNKGK